MGTEFTGVRRTLPYFAYGSNMLGRRLSQRCPSASEIAVASVAGHRLSFDKRSWKDATGKCRMDFTGAPDDLVWGVLFRIDERDLDALDKAEGVGSGYEIGSVVAEVGENKPVSAFTYFADPDFVDPSLVPLDWYVDLVTAGAEEHDLPPEYIQQIREVRATPDPDRQRVEQARSLLGAGGSTVAVWKRCSNTPRK